MTIELPQFPAVTPKTGRKNSHETLMPVSFSFQKNGEWEDVLMGETPGKRKENRAAGRYALPTDRDYTECEKRKLKPAPVTKLKQVWASGATAAEVAEMGLGYKKRMIESYFAAFRAAQF